MAGKEGTAGVRWTSGETKRGAGFDKDICSAGFFKNGRAKKEKKKNHFSLTQMLVTNLP